MSLAILNKPELLDSLKDQVMLEPNENVPYVTVMPPHVDHTQALANFLEACEGLGCKLEVMISSFEEAIYSAIDKIMKSEGGVDASIMKEALCLLKNEILAGLKAASFSGVSADQCTTYVPVLPPLDPTIYEVKGNTFVHHESFWCVPKRFFYE